MATLGLTCQVALPILQNLDYPAKALQRFAEAESCTSQRGERKLLKLS
jgi:hypothetical protein